MSKRITSYVCINLSCRELTHTLKYTFAALEPFSIYTRIDEPSVCARGHVKHTITHRDGSSPFNEHYSIIFKFNEWLVNNINEPGISWY